MAEDFTRRRLLQSAALASAGAFGLTGCGSYLATGFAGSRPPPRTVTYWDLFTGGDGGRMGEMEDAFRKRRPEIDLRTATFLWGDPYYTKLSLAILGDQPPDLAVSHATRVTGYARADLLQPLAADDLARHGLTADRFSRAAWEASHVDGTLYAIPLDTHPWVLYYNTEICERAGLLDSDGILTSLDGPDEFADAMHRVKEATGGWGGMLAININTPSTFRFFYTLYSQLGGQLLADEGRRVVLDEEKAVRALSYGRRLTVEEGLMPADVDYEGAVALFASGKAGFYIQGEWEVTTFTEAKLPFSMVPFPNVFGGPYVVEADSHAFVLPRFRNPDPRRTDAALTVARGLLDESLTWAEGGHVPVWQPVQRSEAYRSLDPQSNYAAAVDNAVYHPPAWYSGSGSLLEIHVGSAVASVLAGQATPEAAVARMGRALQRLAETPSPL
ncbi:MAG: extracellular solute-binding protein [Streptosporangiales bacterium]|nr:extracellular solute-binding protein [Streptosporangiales bacterium]